MGLVTVSLIPQLLAFYLPATRRLFSDGLASTSLVSSQLGLLMFVWANRRYRSFWIMGIGLTMNLLAIVANGGFMPISPATLHQLVPQRPVDSWQIGERLQGTKDVILSPKTMRLSWFADRFTTPPWYPQAVAFSIGDVFIALGTFFFLWQAGRHSAPQAPGRSPDSFSEGTSI